MERLNKQIAGKKERPIKILQFGEGNFLRGFVDYMIDIANEQGMFDGDIVMIKPRKGGSVACFHEQDCQYTVSLRGMVDGEAKVLNRQITSVANVISCYDEHEKYMALAELDTLRFVVSNTTEAGIVFDSTDRFDLKPAHSFPGKLTQILYRRYLKFHGAVDKGLILLPTELIDDNGMMLKQCVNQLIDLWNLEKEFKLWVNDACVFASTLVDRIVTGYPREKEQEEWEKLGYEDRLMVTGEPFALWVIESEKDIRAELPLDQVMEAYSGMEVIFTKDQKPYKQRKVRILNGAHTSFVLASFLCGNDIVLESMKDKDIRNFIKKTIYEEVIPTLDLPKKELEDFAAAVEARFENPYVKHALLAISLNSISKWRARCMPSLLSYVEKFGEIPAHISFSLAALMAFYSAAEMKDGKLIGDRNGEVYYISDDTAVLEFFARYSAKETEEFVSALLSNISFWGQDLTKIPGLKNLIVKYLDDIKTNGMRAALCRI